jgi:ribosomal protein S16
MVKIRLFRVGTHKRPMYRIVAMDHRKIARWIERGAQPSDTVASLLRRHKRQAAAEESAPAS